MPCRPFNCPQKATRTDIRSVAEIESVRLVVDRISQVRAGFQSDDGERRM